MLALSRGEGQSIIIDGRIEVKIVKWSRSSVRLAIQAPREVTVDRDEIWRKMHAGELSPLEKAEIERQERFAREAQAGRSGGGNETEHPAEGDGGPDQMANAATISIPSPVSGVFYTSAGPGGSPYVSSGSKVEEGSLVGTVRDGQSMSDVRAGVKGSVVRVLAGNGQHVTAGQALVLVRRGG